MGLTLFTVWSLPGRGQFGTGRLPWWPAKGAKAKKLQPKKDRGPRLEADPSSMGLSRWVGLPCQSQIPGTHLCSRLGTEKLRCRLD